MLDIVMKTVHRHNDTNLQQKVTLNFDKFHTSSWKLNGLDIGVAVSWCCYCCRCPMSCQNLDLSLQLLPLQTLSSKFIQFSIYFMWHVLLNGLLNVTCHVECLNVLLNVVEMWLQYSLFKMFKIKCHHISWASCIAVSWVIMSSWVAVTCVAVTC